MLLRIKDVVWLAFAASKMRWGRPYGRNVLSEETDEVKPSNVHNLRIC